MKIYNDLDFRYYGFTDQLTTFASVIKLHCDAVGVVSQSERGNVILTTNGLHYAFDVKEVNGYFQHNLIVYNKDRKIELTGEIIYKELAINLFSTLDCIVGTVNIFKEENHFEYEKLLAVEFLAFHLPPECMLLMDYKRWKLYNEYPSSILWENKTKTIEQLDQDSHAVTMQGWYDQSELNQSIGILKNRIWLGQNDTQGSKYACLNIVTPSLSLGTIVNGIITVIDKTENISFCKMIHDDWTDQLVPVSQEVYIGSLLNYIINYPENILEIRQFAKYVDDILQQNGLDILQTRSSALVSFIVNRSAVFTIGDEEFLIFIENYISGKEHYEGVQIRTVGSISDLTHGQRKFLHDIKNTLGGLAILGVNGEDCWILSDTTSDNYKEYLDKNDFIHLINEN